MFNQRSLCILPAALLLLLAVAGCGDDNPASASISWREPAVGSEYTFFVYESLDSTGNPVPDSGTAGLHTITNSVLETGRTYKGVSNLVAVSDAGSILLLDHRSNGDLAFITDRPDTTGNHWFVLPVGTRGTLTQGSGIQRHLLPGVGDTVFSHQVVTTSYAGSESLTVAGESIQTHRINMTLAISSWLSGGVPREDTIRAAYWVAPSIGFFAKSVTIPERNSWTDSLSVMSLKSYVLK